MDSIKLFLIVSSPILGLISYLLFQHYNSGLGGSLYSKRWYLRCALVFIILSILFLVLYFINPNFLRKSIDNQITNRFSDIKWFEIIVSGFIGAIISKIIDLTIHKNKNN